MLTDYDLERISASLSGESGAFPISNLVNYGSTVVVRPGARTAHGVVLSGAEVQARLPSEYVAIPLSVEYAAEPAPSFGEDLLGLYADAMGADSLGAAGPSGVNLRARYARVTARFRYRVSAYQRTGRPGARLRATRALRRLRAIWRRMAQLKVPLAGLVPPNRLASELQGLRAPVIRTVPAGALPVIPTRYLATRPTAPTASVTPTYAPTQVAPSALPLSSVAPVAPVMAPVPPSTYVPTSRVVSALYHRDQAELEREASASTPSYYGASDYAVGQEALASDLRAETIGYLFGPMEHDYYGVSPKEDIEFTSADFTALLSGEAGEALVAFGSDLGVASPSSLVDLLDGVVASERLRGHANRLHTLHPARSLHLRRMADAHRRVAQNAKLGAQDDDLSEADEALSSSTSAPAPLVETSQAKAANLQRRILLPSASELRSVREGPNVLESTARAAKLITQLTDALRSVAPSGSVNYARLRPASGVYGSDPIIVIGIQKKTGSGLTLLESLYEEEVRRVPAGYTVPDAIDAITQNTSVSDYLGYQTILSSLVAYRRPVEAEIYGPILYGAANAFPEGDEAPLPPPRRVGAEVYGA